MTRYVDDYALQKSNRQGALSERLKWIRALLSPGQQRRHEASPAQHFVHQSKSFLQESNHEPRTL